MSRAEKAEDANMEEILASIRKIIADEPAGAPRPVIGSARPPSPPPAPGAPRGGASIRKPVTPPLTGVDDVLDDLANIVQSPRAAANAPAAPQGGVRASVLSGPPPAPLAEPSWLTPKAPPPPPAEATDLDTDIEAALGHDLPKPFFGLGSSSQGLGQGRGTRTPELPQLGASKPGDGAEKTTDLGAFVPRRNEPAAETPRMRPERADRGGELNRGRRSTDLWTSSSDPLDEFVTAPPQATQEQGPRRVPERRSAVDDFSDEIGALRSVLEQPVKGAPAADEKPQRMEPAFRRSDAVANGVPKEAADSPNGKEPAERERPASGGLLRNTIAGLMPKRDEPAPPAAPSTPPVRANPRRFSFSVSSDTPPESDAPPAASAPAPGVAARPDDRRSRFAEKANGIEPVIPAQPELPKAEPIIPAKMEKPRSEVSAPALAAKPSLPEPSPLAAIASSLPVAAAPSSGAESIRTLEDTVAELLRPMLRQWLDANMPRIVEKALKVELAESAKKKS